MALEKGSDLELVCAVRDGRRSAFAELVRRHHGQIAALCRSMLTDEGESEDAAQEVFLKAWRSLGSFDGSAAFSTWLYRIASNHCLDVLRRRARRGTDSLDELIEREGDGVGRLLGSTEEPAAKLEKAELAARLLAALPEQQRLALVLRETQGLSYEEIARVTGWTLDSVKARLRRARETLEGKLRHFL